MSKRSSISVTQVNGDRKMSDSRTRQLPGRMQIVISVFVASLALAGVAAAEDKVLMAIFAHPDDESTVAPILARYVREGVRVHIVIATDGRYGTNDFSEFEAGDDLAAVRRIEMRCAADALGAQLHHLRYHDQLRTGEGYDGHIPHVRALLKDVYALFEEVRPDAVITWGPDGGSNHVDHRLIGATVSNVFLSRQWEKPTALYYYGMPSGLIEDESDKILRGVDDRYMNTVVSYNSHDLEAGYAAVQCHKSQFSPATMSNWLKVRQEGDLKIFLREFAPPASASVDLFN
jgi:LmbE family N-acetylglucosaminyl deacetylase